MKGDLTRMTFRREKHYSGVVMQQGRVQLDADWNEQVDIETHLDQTTRVDVIGRCGMPEDDAGFEVTPSPDQSDLLLSPGRAYVDGILCENDDSPISVEKLAAGQAQLAALVADGRALTEGTWIEIAATGVGPFTARIESVDAADLEIGFAPTLAAADLTSLQNAGDAVVRRTGSYLTQPDYPGVPPAGISADDGMYLAYLDVWERHVTALEDSEIREIALGGPDTASRTQTVWQVKLQRLGDATADLTCATVPDWSSFIDESTALLRARAQPETTSADLCTIPPGAGYRRLENQLYRVEIHDSGSVPAISSSRCQLASPLSVLARRLRPRAVAVSAGSARCGRSPAAASSSTTNRHPVQPSTARSPDSPATKASQTRRCSRSAGAIRPRCSSPVAVSS